MRRYAGDMLDGRNIDYDINFAEEMDQISLGMDKRRHFYLFYKEAINNLVKHASAKNATVALQVSGGQVELDIRDDGIGFDSASPASGNGLASLHKRTAALGGRLKIDSEPGRGTRVRLQFPVT